MIGMGAVDAVLLVKGIRGGLSDLYGIWFGLEVLAEEDDTSMGGPDTRT